MVSIAQIRKLLKSHGHWVQDYRLSTPAGSFKEPTLTPETTKAFQEAVEKYAVKLAIASNLMARSVPRHPGEQGPYGQYGRSGKYSERIHPEDVELAVEHLHELGIDDLDMVVGPEPCPSCGETYTHRVSSSGGYVCPHCFRIIKSMCMAYDTGDELPPEEVAKLKEEVSGHV